MKIRSFFLILLFFLIPAAISGQSVNYTMLGMEINASHMPDGLNEGDKAPDFTGYDQSGKQVVLKDLLKNSPVVLFFYRGNWCPACNQQLKTYQDSLGYITDQGFKLVAITPESIENVEKTVKLHNITFTIIYDCEEKMMENYDVIFNVTEGFQEKIRKSFQIDIARHNGREVAHLPVPATYIINRNGIITAKRFEPDFHKRTSVKWILKNMSSAL